MKINDSVYGQIEIKEPSVLEILTTKPLERIKKVSQSGTFLVHPHKKGTRYEHCVGTMFLLKKFGATLEEQIAGLLHDVPHTAFSHAVDFVFRERETQTYHERFLRKIVFDSEIPQILKRYGIDPERVTDESYFSLLEQEIPSLCADRIDYSLRDMLEDKAITKEEVTQILDSLTTHENRFVLTNENIAYMYASKFMDQCLNSWSSTTTLATFEIFGELVRTAFEENVLIEQDLFGTDGEVLDKLKSANKPSLNKWLELLNPSLKIKLDDGNFDFESRGKPRYIDPPILRNGKVEKLSEINPAFSAKIPNFISSMKKGYHIKVVS